MFFNLICLFEIFTTLYFQKDNSILSGRDQKVAFTVSTVWPLKLFAKYLVPVDR